MAEGKSPEVAQSNNPELQPIDRRGALRAVLGAIGGLGLWASSGASQADAEPPLPLPKRPDFVKEEKTDIVKRIPKPEVPENIKSIAEKRAKIAGKFLRRTPDQDTDIDVEYYSASEPHATALSGTKDIKDSKFKTIQNEKLQIFYNPDKPVPAEDLGFLISLQAGKLIRESNQELFLEEQFGKSFENNLGISIDQIVAGRGDGVAAQMADLEAVSHILGSPSGSKNIFVHKDRRDLAGNLFEAAYANWTNNQEEMSKSISKLSPKLKKGMSNIMLEGLELIMSCAEKGTTLDQVGINRNVVDFVIGMSENPRHKFYFDKIISK